MPFIQQEENQENQNNGQVMTGGGTGTAGNGAMNASTPMNPQNKQGSGRFTNLNKYVTSNQQGSANLANRLGTGIQNQLDTSKKEADTQSNRVAQDINTGRETLGKADQDINSLKAIGEQFKPGFAANQLQDANSRGTFSQGMQAAQAFTQSPNFQNFQNFQAGNAIDNTGINTNLNNAQTAATNLQNQFNTRQQQAGTGAGRQQLLSEFVGGGQSAVRPAYSAGQKKLDQLVLQQNTGNLKNLLNQVGQNKTAVDAINNLVGQQGTDVSSILADETAKINAINDQAKTNQSAFQNEFNEDKRAAVNAARANNYNTIADQLRTGNLSPELYNQLGLTQGLDENAGVFSDDWWMGMNDLSFNQGNVDRTGTDQGYFGLNTYGLIDQIQNNPALMNQFVTRKADITDTNQLGTQADVDTDAALAQILGTTGGRKFLQAGDTSTGPDIGKDAQGKSNFANTVAGRRQQAKDLFGQYRNAFNAFGEDDSTRAAKAAYNERFRQLFGSGASDYSNGNQNIIRRPT